MRLATIVDQGRLVVAAACGQSLLPVTDVEPAFASIQEIAAGGERVLNRLGRYVARQPAGSGLAVAAVEFGPAVPNPGAIFAIGRNYDDAEDAARPPEPPEPPDRRGAPEPSGPSERPLVYAKLPTSVAAHRATISWDRSLAPNVDAEVELGVVVGREVRAATPAEALEAVFGYTCVNDVSARDPWLDGDQWLLGKSMPGFCPIGPWIVTRDEIDPAGLGLGCTINGVAIQRGTTADMRFSIGEIVSYLSRHVVLRPGDVIATGTPARLGGPLGPERHLTVGDEVTVWIEQIGELTTTIA